MATVVEIVPGIREKQRFAQIKEILLTGNASARVDLMLDARCTISRQSPVLGHALDNRASWIIFKALSDTGYDPDEALMLMLENQLAVWIGMDGSAGGGRP